MEYRIGLVKTGYEMRLVKGGRFMMGSRDLDSYADERIVHEVTLDDFLIGVTQVTQELWEEVMGNNPSCFKGKDLPVDNASWKDCQGFINELNKLTEKEYRLPTEAEWEYAARGGQSSHGYRYPGGNDPNAVAWHLGNSDGRTHPVGMKLPNELGLQDMGGNVWEWCSDWYGSYASSSRENPKGPSSGQRRVLRGGSWNYSAGLCRLSYRGGDSPDDRDLNYGLRLAMSVHDSNN